MTDIVTQFGHADHNGPRHANSNEEPHNEKAAQKNALRAANDNPSDGVAGEAETFRISRPDMMHRTIQFTAKRAVDIAASGASLVALAPVLLMIAAAIKLESRGPALFRQHRTGLNGQLFGILKFRSMYTDLGDPTGVAQTVDDDRRITRTGRLLRRTNLDELPQLWNVLVGDMSLVGPRPHVPGMLAAGKPYEELVEGYEHRHMMRPGLTGLAQCRGLRGPTHNRWKAIRRIACDIEYVKNFSLLLDAKIIVRTIVNEFGGGTGS